MIEAIARGTIQNLSNMMPIEILNKFNISSIRLINKAAQKVYKSETNLAFPSLKVYSQNVNETLLSAAYGAAISIMNFK